MATPTISSLPTVAVRSDPSTFSDRADAFMAALVTLRSELNSFGDYMDALAILADGGLYEAQSSTTDTTVGRLMGVGAFGFGSMGNAPIITDFTTELAAGFYRYLGGGAGATGSPDSAAWNGTCIVSRGLDDRATFFAARGATSSPRAWTGTRTTDTGAITWSDVAFQDAEPAFTSIDLNGNIVGGTSVTIADDAVATITPPRTGGFAMITVGGDTEYPDKFGSLQVYFDVGSSLDIGAIWQAPVNPVSAVSIADVTGTTGVDGELTVAVQAGVLKIENRLGSSKTVQVTFL